MSKNVDCEPLTLPQIYVDGNDGISALNALDAVYGHAGQEAQQIEDGKVMHHLKQSTELVNVSQCHLPCHWKSGCLTSGHQIIKASSSDTFFSTWGLASP
ncbi:rCG29114 [Rattus norvegicus]|uniref:RCG29114 n=1 Tax=Rattus norvegicus TaxID=10116 RepID=A6HW55_RAT|nr:rCG29114 [Rattus norvegicus]